MIVHISFTGLLVSVDNPDDKIHARIFIPEYETTVEGTPEQVGAQLLGLGKVVEDAVRRGIAPQQPGETNAD